MTYASSFSNGDIVNLFSDFLTGIWNILLRNGTFLLWFGGIALGVWVLRTLFEGSKRGMIVFSGSPKKTENLLNKL